MEGKKPKELQVPIKRNNSKCYLFITKIGTVPVPLFWADCNKMVSYTYVRLTETGSSLHHGYQSPMVICKFTLPLFNVSSASFGLISGIPLQ